MKILVAGDLFIDNKHKGENMFDSSIIDLFKNVNFSIVNLEAPITKNITTNKIIKTGPHLCSSEDTIIPFLEELEIDLVTLANNHILDYGNIGIDDTLISLNENKIDYVGCGNSLKRASKPYTFNCDGLKIAVLNFAENEWSSADAENPGSNPLDIIENLKQIKLAKLNNDKVICIIHGGHEYYNLPSPRIVKQYRFYAENGVDAIIGHHPHCIGGGEIYMGVPIIYSLGNFTFTMNSKSDQWYKGLLVVLNIEKDENITFEIKPFCQERNTFFSAIAKGYERNEILRDFDNYSQVISNSSKLNESWNSFVRENAQYYLGEFNPVRIFNNKYIISGLRKLKMDKIFLRKSFYKSFLNMMRCEAHRDSSISILNNFISKK